jgi:hypothetical protein
MDQVWDPHGEADVALARVVEGFGPQVLGRADMFEGLLQDDIPQLPRAVALLTAASRSGVAELLAERVRQGISPQAAVTMAAADMTARTAVDASGALWAAGVFARVLGYRGPPPGTPVIQDAPTQVPTAPAPAAQVPPPAPAPTAPVAEAGRDAWGRPVPDVRGTGPQAARPYGDPLLTVPPPAQGGRGLAIAASVSAAIAAPMVLIWSLTAQAHGAFFWLAAILVMAGLVGVALWAVRGWRGGAGFAAVLGLAVPIAAWGIYGAAASPSFFGLSALRRDVLELASALWLLAALTATLIAVAGLVRSHQLGRSKPGFLPAALTAAGVGYALANIVAQDTSQGQPFDNVLGPGVVGWYIVWGLAFLVLVSLPPVLAAFFLPSSGVRLAVWSGWLLFALAWQLSDTPTNGLKAAPGLYLTWILWIAVLAGTVIMAAGRRAGATGGRAAYG